MVPRASHDEGVRRAPHRAAGRSRTRSGRMRTAIMDRRSFLRISTVGTAAAVVGIRGFDLALPAAHAASGPYGPLQPADGNGIRLPPGFTSRVVARSGSRVGPTSY